MPYLEYLFCEHCGNHAKLDLDPGATVTAYRKDGRSNVALLQPTMIWDYLIYSCGICKSQFKYNYRDVERRVREYFSSLSNEFKEYFDEVVEQSENLSKTSPHPKVEERVRNLYTAKS